MNYAEKQIAWCYHHFGQIISGFNKEKIILRKNNDFEITLRIIVNNTEMKMQIIFKPWELMYLFSMYINHSLHLRIQNYFKISSTLLASSGFIFWE